MRKLCMLLSGIRIIISQSCNGKKLQNTKPANRKKPMKIDTHELLHQWTNHSLTLMLSGKLFGYLAICGIESDQ